MTNKIAFLIGVDGGGSTTRVAIADKSGLELARATSGPSGLIGGAERAWLAIQDAITAAFANMSCTVPDYAQMAISLGLAGVHNRQWAVEFETRNPGFAHLSLETDAYTTLLAAHAGQPGAIIALGTGSVGEALLADGSRREVGGWGFPIGDEAGGAWFGQRAIQYLQQVLDGRAAPGLLSEVLMSRCGRNRHELLTWLAQADQFSFAQLAPLVIKLANKHESVDTTANNLVQEAALEIERIALALDESQSLPIALCGGLAKSLEAHLSKTLLQRIVPARGDAVSGALLLLNSFIGGAG